MMNWREIQFLTSCKRSKGRTKLPSKDITSLSKCVHHFIDSLCQREGREGGRRKGEERGRDKGTEKGRDGGMKGQRGGREEECF